MIKELSLKAVIAALDELLRRIRLLEETKQDKQ